MSGTPAIAGRPLRSASANTIWFIALAGFASMALPTYWWAAGSIWQTDDQGHGPVIVLVLAWLFWTLRHEIAESPASPQPLIGWPVFAAGLLSYITGRAFGISILELGSQALVVAGLLLLIKGPAALRVAWFAVFYFVFMIPLPGFLVDAMTGPLKQWISGIVVELLYALGYPIARSGVAISIGPYQMLVADACSGLHSMFSLAALGTLFLYIVGRPSKLHNLIMLASILPIAFAANIVRVVILVLVTYHLGDEAGQGFLHGAAGMALMLVALVLLVALDTSLSRLIRRHAGVARAPG